MELQLQDLTKQYKEKCAVNHVSASLSPGVYGLLGANGAGKTTLMRMICGILKPTSGSIRFNGKTIEQLGERYYTHLGYMPQYFGFYPDFTAREFMLYPEAKKVLKVTRKWCSFAYFRNIIHNGFSDGLAAPWDLHPSHL